jgi:mannose-6-phosphate isomerase-like protein (cupin superfamily)
MSLVVTNLASVANKLSQPFHIAQLAVVGSLSLGIFVCQGQVNWHRHLDEDELFLVHEGVVALDTERGRLTLHSEELAVVPKGVGHRTGSQLRSVVLLLRPTVLTNRTNGHRHGVVDTDPPLEKVRLARVLTTLPGPYQAMAVARVEHYDVLLLSALGSGQWDSAPEAGALCFVLRGAVVLDRGSAAGARLEAGELTLIPAGERYRLSANEPSLLLTLAPAD